MPGSAGSTFGSRPVPVIAAVLVGGLFLHGCGGKPEVSRSATQYTDGPQCMFELAARGVEASQWQAPQTGSCAVSTPLRVLAAGIELEPGLNSSCAMVLQWLTFTETVNQLALRHLGAPIRTVHHLGSYNCRRMSGNRNRLSLHATARALDLYAFDTTAGERISVKNDYRSGGPKGDFLRAMARASCDQFGVVLTPNHDAAHHDHIHIDIGPWKLCGV